MMRDVRDSRGSRYGNSGDRREKDRGASKLTKKTISKPDKYREGLRKRRGSQDSDDGESSGFEPKEGEQAGEEVAPKALDDGQTRSEVAVNFISKSAGILKAETMQEEAIATKDDKAGGDDWEADK